MTESLPLDGESLSSEQFLAVVRGGCPVSLTPEARQRIAASRRVVERAVQSGRTIYGVTTGFGSLADRAIPREEARNLQLSLVRSHASGTGPALPEDVVRGHGSPVATVARVVAVVAEDEVRARRHAQERELVPVGKNPSA